MYGSFPLPDGERIKARGELTISIPDNSPSPCPLPDGERVNLADVTQEMPKLLSLRAKRSNLAVSYQNDEIASSRRLLAMTRCVTSVNSECTEDCCCKKMLGDRIELSTPGFSDLCSTN